MSFKLQTGGRVYVCIVESTATSHIATNKQLDTEMVCANIIQIFMSKDFNASQNHSSFTCCICYLAINQSLILGPHPPVQPAKPGAVLIRQIRAYVSVI